MMVGSFCFVFFKLQGQFSHMESTQNDVRPSAVFCPAGQRGGRPQFLSPMLRVSAFVH